MVKPLILRACWFIETRHSFLFRECSWFSFFEGDWRRDVFWPAWDALKHVMSVAASYRHIIGAILEMIWLELTWLWRYLWRIWISIKPLYVLWKYLFRSFLYAVKKKWSLPKILEANKSDNSPQKTNIVSSDFFKHFVLERSGLTIEASVMHCNELRRGDLSGCDMLICWETEKPPMVWVF